MLHTLWGKEIMTERISLKRYEQKAFASRFEDGLWDIFVGCFFSQLAVGPYLSKAGLGDFWPSAIFALLLLLLLLAIWFIKRQVIKPRIGEMRPGPWRKNRLMVGTLVLLIINVILFILGIVVAVGSKDLRNLGSLPTAGLALCIILFLSAVAYIFDVPRFYFYGALLALAAFAGEWLYANRGVPHHGLGVSFGIGSGAIILTGIVLLVRFLYRYPVAGENLEEERG
jgi:predicted small integral membrane protein